ncbi:MAG TPA: hypothetical protein VFO40_23885, partial [Chthoniobacterales bacterium]|nr:hypothetical protein [Chthoniobacterales bacterium]
RIVSSPDGLSLSTPKRRPEDPPGYSLRCENPIWMIKWIFGHRGHHRLYKLRQGALGMSRQKLFQLLNIFALCPQE